MDPLSVMASVAGLLTAAHEVAKLLGPYVSASRETPSIAAHAHDETESTRTVLIGLQTLVRELSGTVSRRGALIGVDQVVAILTGGVLLFAELEGAVQGLIAVTEGKATERGVLGIWSTRNQLRLRARMQWARQEASLKSLLVRLQGFKVSVTVVLTLLRCDSDRRAQQLQVELAANVGALLESNHEISRRMMHLEDAFDTKTINGRRSAIESVASASTLSLPPALRTPKSVLWEFENELETSRVYRRAQRNTMDCSFRGSVARTHAWSTLSWYSLADVSVLSVIALPLDLDDITNKHHYIDTNSAPMVKKEPSAPISEPSLAEEGSIFHDCLRIYSQLLQISGFQELFNEQWQAQLEEKGMDMGMIIQGEDNREQAWQHLDVLGVLKGMFSRDTGYWLLAHKLRPYQDSRNSSPLDGQKVTYLMQLFYDDLGFIPERFAWNEGPTKDTVKILKAIASLSNDLERLAIHGVINRTEDDVLAALISDIRESSQFPVSIYKQALEKFVYDQRLFIRDLLGLISASENMAQDSSTPLVLDELRITTKLLSSYASSEIELLLTIERMLLAPPRLHLWAATIRQWSAIAETHRAWIIIKEQKARRALHDALPSSVRGTIPAIQTDRTLVTSCLGLLSRPLQRFSRTAHFFQEILEILLKDFTGIGEISPAQRDDFTEGERLVKYTLGIAEGDMSRDELIPAAQNLVLRVEDWKNQRVEEFGRLIRVDRSSISAEREYKPGGYHVYVFDNILLCLEENTLDAKIRPNSVGSAEATKAAVTDKSNKLLLKRWIILSRIIDVNCFIRPDTYETKIFWQSNTRSAIVTHLSFMNEWQMVEWCRSLMELMWSHHRPLTAPLFM